MAFHMTKLAAVSPDVFFQEVSWAPAEIILYGSIVIKICLMSNLRTPSSAHRLATAKLINWIFINSYVFIYGSMVIYCKKLIVLWFSVTKDRERQAAVINYGIINPEHQNETMVET